MNVVQTLLRRLMRLKTLRDREAPPALVAAEDALIQQSISELSPKDLLQVAEQFSDYRERWERSA